MKNLRTHLSGVKGSLSLIAHRSGSIKPGLFSFLLALFIASSGMLAQPVANAQSAADETACKTYKVVSELNACKDGYNGVDCSTWLVIEDEKHKNICDKGTELRTEVTDNPSTGGGTTQPGPKPNTGTDAPAPGKNSSNDGTDQLKKSIDQLRALNKENKSLDNKLNPDEIQDNKYGQYVNGAGKLQPIRISKASGDRVPAIIFFNGGGWHQDDRSGDNVAPKANERGYSTFNATYRLGSSGIYYIFEDVMRAVKHVRDNADMYNIDPARIAVWGDSAGGSLAMRVAASGKSGAAAAVGWSAPTNAFTGLFKGPEAFAIGMDHSTCAPTDLNGLDDYLKGLNGQEETSVDDGGLGNNGTAGTDTALGTVTQVLELAQRAQSTSQTNESMSKGLESGEGGGGGDTSENVRNLAAKKYLECIDNFTAASPALYASGLTPPTFLAGFQDDWLIDPGQAYQMRDKLRSLGVQSDVLILPGRDHLGFNENMIKPSLDFLDRFLHPANAPAQ